MSILHSKTADQESAPKQTCMAPQINSSRAVLHDAKILRERACARDRFLHRSRCCGGIGGLRSIRRPATDHERH